MDFSSSLLRCVGFLCCSPAILSSCFPLQNHQISSNCAIHTFGRQYTPGLKSCLQLRQST